MNHFSKFALLSHFIIDIKNQFGINCNIYEAPEQKRDKELNLNEKLYKTTTENRKTKLNNTVY